ncbi:MAG: glycosyltransferase family 4 protein [Pseudomonadota bacterium]
MAERPRVLLLAEEANPEFVSVPLIGFSLAHALREVADTHLVTQIRNTPALERAGYTAGIDYTAIDTEDVAARWTEWAWRLRRKGGNWSLNTMFASAIYPIFERRVWARFGPEIRAGRYDVVHRITPVSPVFAGCMARHCARAGVPFVLGPLNGGLKWPHAFRAERAAEREGLGRLRPLYRANPGWRRMIAQSSAILAAAAHVEADLPASARAKTIRLPENGIDRARFPCGAAEARLSRTPGPGPTLRACFIGRLAAVKGLDLGIDAGAPLLADGRMTLDIVGEGEMRPLLEAQVARLGLGHAVTFHGWLPQAEIAPALTHTNVLLFPSLKDFGGGAVLEAMALGLVPVVLDYGGPAELVTPACGIAVPMTDRAGTTVALRNALERLAADNTGIAAMARAAVDRVDRAFTWRAKAEQIAEVYAYVRGARATKPDFAFSNAPGG